MNSRLPSSISIEPLPESWVERMFDRMLLEYGKKFVDQWAGADSEKLIEHWAHEMAGYNGVEIKRGLSKLSVEEWPPTLPMFKKLCRPAGDSVSAYYQAVEGVAARARGEMGAWSHPAIYWAAIPMAFDLGSQSFSQMKSRWENAFTEQMDRGEWSDIPQPIVALPAPGKSAFSREKATAMVAELGLKLQKTNHTIWYENILERLKRGDKTLSMVQINFAKEAARNHGVKDAA